MQKFKYAISISLVVLIYFYMLISDLSFDVSLWLIMISIFVSVWISPKSETFNEMMDRKFKNYEKKGISEKLVTAHKIILTIAIWFFITKSLKQIPENELSELIRSPIVLLSLSTSLILLSTGRLLKR